MRASAQRAKKKALLPNRLDIPLNRGFRGTYNLLLRLRSADPVKHPVYQLLPHSHGVGALVFPSCLDACTTKQPVDLPPNLRPLAGLGLPCNPAPDPRITGIVCAPFGAGSATPCVHLCCFQRSCLLFPLRTASKPTIAYFLRLCGFFFMRIILTG
jgi:hypothetical protein